jgi:hypothetical protein
VAIRVHFSWDTLAVKKKKVMTAGVRWQIAGTAWLAAALLLLAGCVSLTAGIDCEAPLPAPSAPATGKLTAISWNVHGLPFDQSLGGRLDNVAGEIRRRLPDVVLLQEAWIDGAAGRLECRLRGRYERVADPDGVRSGGRWPCTATAAADC